MTRVTVFYESKLKEAADKNSLMGYFNVPTLGLRGRHHPALANQLTSNDIRISRPQLKLLAGNYLTYKIKSDQSGESSACRICCSGTKESVSHVVCVCQGMVGERNRIFSIQNTMQYD